MDERVTLRAARFMVGLSETTAAKCLGIQVEELIEFEQDPGRIPLSLARKFGRLYGVRLDNIRIEKT